MKKTIHKLILLSVLTMGLWGCQKEVLEPVETETADAILPPAFTRPVVVEDGALVFENEAHLDATIEQLSAMSATERLAYEDRLGFRSLGSIYHLVNEAEIAHHEAFFAGLDPNLPVATYEQMGYHYKHTGIYMEYLSKGVIRACTYPDGSRAFALTVDNPMYANVLNTDGALIVGDRKLVFQGDSYTEFDRLTNTVLSPDAGNKVTENNEYNLNLRIHRGGYETADGNLVWIFDPALGSNYRYFGRVIFRSGYTTSTLSQTFFVESIAQQKRFGNWATRNHYNPIWGVNANWRYDYWIIYNGAGFGVVRDGSQYPLPNMTPRPTSPYYTSGLNSNHIQTWLHPHGFFARSSSIGWNFFENVRVYNYSFVFNYSGGPSGYGYTAY